MSEGLFNRPPTPGSESQHVRGVRPPATGFGKFCKSLADSINSRLIHPPGKCAAKERGAAVLCSLHQIDLARSYADRIIGLNDGQIVFDGPPDALSRDAVQSIFNIAPGASVVRREVA